MIVIHDIWQDDAAIWQWKLSRDDAVVAWGAAKDRTVALAAQRAALKDYLGSA